MRSKLRIPALVRYREASPKANLARRYNEHPLQLRRLTLVNLPFRTALVRSAIALRSAGQHEASAILWKLSLIFIRQLFERVTHIVVRHDACNTPAAIDLLFQLFVVHD